jgi:DNA-binding transcriptional MerR regulator
MAGAPDRTAERAISAPEPDEVLSGIGAVAEATGVSERTLRYYEELGLILPAAYSPGGSRRYSRADVARVEHIRTLQSLMGFNLEEIKDVLEAEDHLDAIRRQYLDGGPVPKAILLATGIATLEDLHGQVQRKIDRLEQFRSELEARIARVKSAAERSPD